MDSEMPGMAKTVSQMFQKDPTEIPSKTKLAYAIDLEWKILVPGAGLEPARCYQRGILNHTIKNSVINKINLNFKI